MKEAIIEIIKWVRESVRPLVVLLVVSLLVTLCPRTWASAIGLADSFPKYRLWGCLGFAVSSVWLLSLPIERRYHSSQKRKRLHRLTADEYSLLRGFLLNRKRTQYFGWQTIAVAETLARAGVLSKLDIKDGGGANAFELNEWAYSYLCDHLELLGIPKNPVNIIERKPG
jgi:hypothetical protein